MPVKCKPEMLLRCRYKTFCKKILITIISIAPLTEFYNQLFCTIFFIFYIQLLQPKFKVITKSPGIIRSFSKYLSKIFIFLHATYNHDHHRKYSLPHHFGQKQRIRYGNLFFHDLHNDKLPILSPYVFRHSNSRIVLHS